MRSVCVFRLNKVVLLESRYDAFIDGLWDIPFLGPIIYFNVVFEVNCRTRFQTEKFVVNSYEYL